MSGFQAFMKPAGCWYFLSMASQIHSPEFARNCGMQFHFLLKCSHSVRATCPFLLYNIKNKVKIPNREMGQRSQWTFHEGIHVAMKNLKRCSRITNGQRKANQKPNELSPHIQSEWPSQRISNSYRCRGCGEKERPCTRVGI